MMKQSGLDEALITCFLFLYGMRCSAASVFWNMNIWFIELNVFITWKMMKKHILINPNSS